MNNVLGIDLKLKLLLKRFIGIDYLVLVDVFWYVDFLFFKIKRLLNLFSLFVKVWLLGNIKVIKII